MQYLDEEIHTPLRLAIPPSLKDRGEVLQDILGEDAVVITPKEDIFCDALEAGLANAWVADFAFIEEFCHEQCIELSQFPLLLIRTPAFPLTSRALNQWTPSAFLDLPLDPDEVKRACEHLEKALHVKEGLVLLQSLRSSLKKGQSRQVVLDMERAFDKEISIIRNDLYYQEIAYPHLPHTVLRLDMVYKPMELLSGDSYSVRVIDEHRVACFLIDAMSKGVVAALTSTSSTSMLNYLIDELNASGMFSLDALVKKYLGYIKRELMEDEIVSAFFMVFDKRTMALEYASFGMPPFLASTPQGECEFIKGNNMPISAYTETFKTSARSMHGFDRFLAYSDGLNESEIENGGIYKGELPEDFVKSANITDFMQRVARKIGNGNDDIAYFYLQGINTQAGQKHETLCQSTRESIEEGLFQVKPFLETYGAHSKMIAQVTLALSELLTNALEHGNFGINKQEKHRHIQADTFDATMEALEAKHAHLEIKLTLRAYTQRDWTMFEASVEDVGRGFDTHMVKNIVVNPASFNGRGFMIVKKLVDRFYFNAKGNRITLLKRLVKG
jgi:anti-sigma regulatory factor (Ser/Thr protein kinase)